MSQIVDAIIFIILLAYHAFLMYSMSKKDVVPVIRQLNSHIEVMTGKNIERLTIQQRHVAKQISDTSVTRVKRAYRFMKYNLYGVMDVISVILFILGQALAVKLLVYLAALLLLAGCVTLTYCLFIYPAMATYLKAMEAHLR